jgi:hypothetical protein
MSHRKLPGKMLTIDHDNDAVNPVAAMALPSTLTRRRHLDKTPAIIQWLVIFCYDGERQAPAGSEQCWGVSTTATEHI